MDKLNSYVSHQNYEAFKLVDSIFKNSLEKRIVIVGGGDYNGEDVSEFINCSEYVVRTDYGKNIPTEKLGYKTDILYLDRINFIPFSLEKMKDNFSNFMYKTVFENSNEIWLPIHFFLINELFLKLSYPESQPKTTGGLLKESWDNDVSRELLYFHIKKLLAHHKRNVKMLDFDEFDQLINSINPDSMHYTPSPVLYTLSMVESDSRFNEYECYVINLDMEYSRPSVNSMNMINYDIKFDTDLKKDFEYIKKSDKVSNYIEKVNWYK